MASLLKPWEKPKRFERAHRNDLLDVFYKYATVEEDGYKFIKSTDFIQKFLGISNSSDANLKTVELLAGIIDTTKDGRISFPEFVAFEGLLCIADALYFIAFQLFDDNGNGLISFDEFHKIISHTTLQKKIPFNMEGDFVRMYFGKRKDRVVSYPEFSQFLHDFHEEYAIEAFRKFDLDFSGCISSQEFILIMTNIRPHLLTSSVTSKLNEVVESLSESGRVSFPFFMAFNSLLNNMELMKKVYLQASRSLPNVEISKQEFLHSAQMISQVTPLQVDILFKLSELINVSPTIILADLQVVAPEQCYVKVEKRILDIKAVRSPEERGFAIELLESFYRFCIGCIAGAIEACPAYPTDLVKTRMQLQRPSRLVEGKFYRNSLDCFKKIVKVEGVKGLYKGLAPEIIASSIGRALKLSLNDWIRDQLMNRKGQVTLSGEIFAGACAGACSAFVANPLEIVKIRMQSIGQLFPNVKFGTFKLIRQLGFRGMFKGMTACLLRDVPFSAVFFPTYAHLKIRLQDDDGYNSPTSLMIAGTAASIPALPLSMPFDVIKTRLQVAARPGETVYSGTIDCALKIMKEEGPRAFIQGTRVIKPSQVGLTVLIYEVLQRMFYVDFAGTRPTGSEARIVITNVDQMRSENPDHIGGYALALPILAGIESKFGLVFPKFKHQVFQSLV